MVISDEVWSKHQVGMDYLDNLPSTIIRICEDCGYQHTTDLMEVNND